MPDRPNRAPRPGALPLLLIAGAACAPARYVAAPLAPEEAAAARVASRRDVALDEGALTLDAAALLLRERSPAVRDAVAAFEAARAVADVAAPWPDPTLAVGVDVGLGDDVDRNEVVPAAELGLTVPVGGRRARQDELHRAEAEAARVHALAAWREAVLELRGAYLGLAHARARAGLVARLAEGAARSRRGAATLAEVGDAGALDVSAASLELARVDARALAARHAAADAAHRLAGLLALDGARVAPLAVDGLPELAPAPPMEDLRPRLTGDHPDLARLAAAYAVAEARLALEVARAVPDLDLGLAFAGDPGETKEVLGLLLGGALPLFDRNRLPIAAARAAREEARVAFDTELDRALSALARAHAADARAAERRAALEARVLPAAREHLRVARAALEAGGASGLRVLDAERSLREVELEALAAAAAALDARLALERALGAPVDGDLPDPPAALVDLAPERTR